MDHTPLIYASLEGKAETVEFLISNGADVKAKDADACTALIHASWQGHTAIMKQLIQKDPDVIHQETNNGCNALFIALYHQQLDAIKTILEKTANPRTQCGGFSPMHYAAYHNRVDIADLLLLYGFNINGANKKGISPMAVAIERGSIEMLRWLITHEAVFTRINYLGPISKSLTSHVKACKPTRYLPKHIEKRLYSPDAFAEKEKKRRACKVMLDLMKHPEKYAFPKRLPLMAPDNSTDFTDEIAKCLTDIQNQVSSVENKPKPNCAITETYEATIGITIKKRCVNVKPKTTGKSEPPEKIAPATQNREEISTGQLSKQQTVNKSKSPDTEEKKTIEPHKPTQKPTDTSHGSTGSKALEKSAASHQPAKVQPKVNNQKNVEIAATETPVKDTGKTLAVTNGAKTSTSPQSAKQQTVNKLKSPDTGEKKTTESHKPTPKPTDTSHGSTGSRALEKSAASHQSAKVQPKVNNQKNVKIAAPKTSVKDTGKTIAVTNSSKTSTSQPSKQQTTKTSKSGTTDEKFHNPTQKPSDASNVIRSTSNGASKKSDKSGTAAKSASHSPLSRTSEK